MTDGETEAQKGTQHVQGHVATGWPITSGLFSLPASGPTTMPEAPEPKGQQGPTFPFTMAPGAQGQGQI